MKAYTSAYIYIYLLTRHGYEGDGVRSCEVDFLFLFTYFTISISFFASLFKVVSTPAPAKVPPPPTKSPCSLACGHNALCKVLFCLLFSFVRSSLRKLVPLKTHCFNFHSAKDVTSKQTNKCNNSCIIWRSVPIINFAIFIMITFTIISTVIISWRMARLYAVALLDTPETLNCVASWKPSGTMLMWPSDLHTS